MLLSGENSKKVKLLKLVVAFVLATLFIILMVFSLIVSLYDMYYGDSSVGDFFREQGQNIFTTDVRVTTFRYLIYRVFYSILPFWISFTVLFLYVSKSFSEKVLSKKIFQDNPSLSKILMILRYMIGIGLFFFVIMYQRTFISSTFHNCIIGSTGDFIRLYIAGFVLLIPIIRWKDIVRDIRSFPKRHPLIYRVIFMLFIAIVSCCLVEFQIGSKMRILVYLIHINIMYWFILQLTLYVLIRNPKPGAVISLVFAYVIGLANDVVYQFRGNYIMFGDLTVVRTALEVAGNYTYKPTVWFWLSLGVLIFSIVLVILIKLNGHKSDETDKRPNVKKRVVSTLMIEGLIAVFVIITFKTGDFYGKVFGVGWDYNQNVTAVGYLPYFLSNMDSTRRVVVDGYSSESARETLDGYKNEGSNELKDSIKYPNIILIQNEAFSDLSITADIETDVDPMPFIHSMTENTQKGYLNMSVTGGPTSNTEFEVLSRSSLQYFPYGSVPYTQYLKQNIPSLVECLKNQSTPYRTVAYHSYYSSGYNRNSVYSFLGFDNKLFENNFLNDFPESDLPRGYLSDEANYRRVISEYEKCAASETPFFCFNVTIQGHGGYTGGPFDWNEPVRVTNFAATDSINTYLSSVHLSDKAFEGLVEYFKSVDAPTIIMMYGDHQPSWDDEAKEILEQHTAWEDSDLQALSRYYVPYVVWTNFDIDEYDHLLKWKEKASDIDSSTLNKLSTNYVGSYLLKTAGVELSAYDRYLLSLHEDIPAITAIGIWDKNGEYYTDTASSPYADKLKEQEYIQYNLIFDDKNKLNKEFLP